MGMDKREKMKKRKEDVNTIEETRKLLRKFEYKYNCERRHQSLNYLAPMEDYYTLKEKVA